MSDTYTTITASLADVALLNRGVSGFSCTG